MSLFDASQLFGHEFVGMAHVQYMTGIGVLAAVGYMQCTYMYMYMKNHIYKHYK